MFADVVDYSEWKTGRRTTGVIYATILFGLKTGLSLGGAMAGWLLSGYGYRPNAVQTPEALQGIRMTISVYPAIFFVIVIACLIGLPDQQEVESADTRRTGGARRNSHRIGVNMSMYIASFCWRV